MRWVVAANEGGTSLIEVLMVAIIVAIGLGIALPPLQGVVADGRMSSARSRITTTFAQARHEAVARGRDVVICPSGADGACLDAVDWHGGWVSFEDRDGDGRRDRDEPQLALGGPTTGVKIVATGGRKLLRYQSDGSAPGSNVTLTFCDHRGAGQATALALNSAGRLRRVPATSQNTAIACAAE